MSYRSAGDLGKVTYMFGIYFVFFFYKMWTVLLAM